MNLPEEENFRPKKFSSFHFRHRKPTKGFLICSAVKIKTFKKIWLRRNQMFLAALIPETPVISLHLKKSGDLPGVFECCAIWLTIETRPVCPNKEK